MLRVAKSDSISELLSLSGQLSGSECKKGGSPEGA